MGASSGVPHTDSNGNKFDSNGDPWIDKVQTGPPTDSHLSQSQIADGRDQYWNNRRNGDPNTTQDAIDGKYGPEAQTAALAQVNGDEGDYANTNSHLNPGSADVGGYAGAGQAIHDDALANMHKGDAAYDANGAAMQNSINNMTGNRGEMAPENATLMGREAATRQQQIGSLDIQRRAAEGGAPSAANYQTQGAMDAQMGSQAGNMGSARGLSALGGAQNVGNQALGQSGANTMMAGGMGRSKEIGDAIGMYGTSANQVRSGDMARLQQGDTNSLGNAGLNNDWKLGNAGLAAKQGQLGNEQERTRAGWYDASTVPAQNQAKNDQTMKGMDQCKSSADARAAVASAQAERDRNQKLVQGGTTAGLTAVGGIVGGPGGAFLGGMAGSGVNKATEDLW